MGQHMYGTVYPCVFNIQLGGMLGLGTIAFGANVRTSPLVSFRFVHQLSWLVVMSRVLQIFVFPPHTRIMYMSPRSFYGSTFGVNDPFKRFARRSSQKLFDFGSYVHVKELLSPCTPVPLDAVWVFFPWVKQKIVARECFSSGIT